MGGLDQFRKNVNFPLEIWPLIDEKALLWNDFVDAFPTAQYCHNSRYLSLVQDIFRLRDRSVYIEDKGEIVAICPLLEMTSLLHGFQKLLVSAPFCTYASVLSNSPEATSLMLDYLQETARSEELTLQLRCLGPDLQRSEYVRNDSYTTFRLGLEELRQDPEALYLSKLSGRNRSKIRKAKREGVRISFGETELIEDFFSLYFEQQRTFGTPPYPLDFFKRLLQDFPGSEIALATVNGKSISAIFNVAYGKTLSYCFAGSSPLRGDSYANNLLFFEVVVRATQKGFRVFDLGRSELGGGTYQFKKQWRAEIVPLRYLSVGRLGKKLGGTSISQVRDSLAFRAFHTVWSKVLPDRIIELISPELLKRMPLA